MVRCPGAAQQCRDGDGQALQVPENHPAGLQEVVRMEVGPFRLVVGVVHTKTGLSYVHTYICKQLYRLNRGGLFILLGTSMTLCTL